MIPSRTITILSDIIRRESRSFLAYLSDSLPWPSVDDDDIERHLVRMAESERLVIGDMSRFLGRHHVVPPYLGAYPSHFTVSNFVSLRYLLPHLIEEQGRATVAFERDLSVLGDAEARALVQRLLDTKRRHVAELEKIQRSTSVSTAAH